MKKLLALLMAVCMALMLTACYSPAIQTSEDNSATNAAAQEPEPTEAPWLAPRFYQY